MRAFAILGALAVVACAPPQPETPSLAALVNAEEDQALPNPVLYFEIPVTDMDRAIAFYQAVFGYDFTRETIDGYDMALFPFSEGGPGATGALAKGDVYVPSLVGPIIYFRVETIDPVLTRAQAQGGEILYPKKDIGPLGFVAEIKDSEGNRIALSQTAAP
jgi:predicted enzyme related to lactoylglutathione lyase